MRNAENPERKASCSDNEAFDLVGYVTNDKGILDKCLPVATLR